MSCISRRVAASAPSFALDCTFLPTHIHTHAAIPAPTTSAGTTPIATLVRSKPLFTGATPDACSAVRSAFGSERGGIGPMMVPSCACISLPSYVNRDGIAHALPRVKSLAAAQRLVHQFRLLTRHTDRPCLVACSGGLDSTALLLALAASGLPLCVGHVVHDMRPLQDSLADRDHVRDLAGMLSIPFHERRIEARPVGGNLESTSRRLRYEALLAIAHSASLPFIATAHHADDQAETVLMRLLRGSGPAGLRAIRSSRRLSPEVTLIRPALDLERDDLRAICTAAGLTWREDPTNADPTHLRARMRLTLMPLLRELSPGSPRRIARFARLNASLLRTATPSMDALFAEARREQNTITFSRDALKSAPEFVAGAVIRKAILAHSPHSQDRLGHALVSSILRAVRDSRQHRREFRVGTTLLRVDALEVAFIRETPDTLSP